MASGPKISINSARNRALALLLRHELPAAPTACDFLVQFHAEDLPAPQKDRALVTVETAPPCGLATATVELVFDRQCRRPVRPAMPDVGATVIHCDKHAAKRTHDGHRGSRPVLAR